MSNSRSSQVADPLRPSDHVDGDERMAGPTLGVVGWLRWGWRQLTSMRTALVLLLLLAIAAIPGSIVPQRSADPNGVIQWKTQNPDLFPVLDTLQLFDVYTSVWFSAIYILLFISLIGCVIPRTKHHWQAMKAAPPRTPARLSRLSDYQSDTWELTADQTPATVIDSAEAHLKKSGYRVHRYDTEHAASVSAERGYLRETGNLVFHVSLVGVLLAVGIGGGFTYTGQTVIAENESFVNSLGLGYTSFNPGRFVDTEALPPYSLTLKKFDVTYTPLGAPGAGMAGDYAAHLSVQEPGKAAVNETVRVNHPLELDGDRVYLMGNGYAPTITIRNAAGTVVFSEPVPFLSQDTNMTSVGVVKVPDGLKEQVGLVGFFYPTAATLNTGATTSAFGALKNPLLTFNVYVGDLGINGGAPRSVYALDTSGMKQIAGRGTSVGAIELAPGDSAKLPDGLGSVTFEDATVSGAHESVKRYVSLSIHRDPGSGWVLAFCVLALLGLLAGLFIPRRRVWVKATPTTGAGVSLEYAGLARGEDPAIAHAVAEITREHGAVLRAEGNSGPA